MAEKDHIRKTIADIDALIAKCSTAKEVLEAIVDDVERFGDIPDQAVVAKAKSAQRVPRRPFKVREEKVDGPRPKLGRVGISDIQEILRRWGEPATPETISQLVKKQIVRDLSVAGVLQLLTAREGKVFARVDEQKWTVVDAA